MKMLVVLLMVFITLDGFTQDNILELRIEKVNPGGRDMGGATYEFITEHGVSIEYFCYEHTDYVKPYISYHNYYDVWVRDFQFKKLGSCNKLNTYLRGVFHGIGPDNPILIKLNKITGQIEDFVVPDLDPYQYGPPGEQNIDFTNTLI
jgi:hypothetical protein